MGQQQSKDELLYQQVNYGNIEGIKALRREGAGLEWIDREGKTALIAACMNPELYNVAKTLIELGANVNAYRPARHAGTPLHHAAKRGLEQTVKLLLSHGANALVMNDDCQTPLDVARIKGYGNVVRTIESHLCLFSGWLREIYGPGFLELFAPQLLSRKVWVVILPCGSRNLQKPFKLELAIYSSSQDAQPRTIIALWKANMEEPKFNLPDPAVILSDISSIPRRWRKRRGVMSNREARSKPRGLRKTHIKLVPENEREKQQLQRFCDACKGIPQVMHPTFPFNTPSPFVPATAPPTAEISTSSSSGQSSSIMEVRPPPVDGQPGSGAHASASWTNAVDAAASCSGTSSAPPSKGSSYSEAGPSCHRTDNGGSTFIVDETRVSTAIPSAPPIESVIVDDDDGSICYPSIDSGPIDLEERKESNGGGGGTSSSSCVICLDAPVQGACIPCGHMVGCMTCLKEIKDKNWGCPVCRAKIDQVIRLYAV